MKNKPTQPLINLFKSVPDGFFLALPEYFEPLICFMQFMTHTTVNQVATPCVGDFCASCEKWSVPHM